DMPRIARIIVPKLPYHVTQRGNFGQNIFEDDADRNVYLEWLQGYGQRYGTKFWAYCLMTNHVHYIAIPEDQKSLALTFNQTHMRYSQYTNKKHNRRGHLWQGRFYSCVLDDEHLYSAVRYVERNPVRANMVQKSETYKWSSAPAHVFKKEDPLLSIDCPLIEAIEDWNLYLLQADDDEWMERFRVLSRTGRPAGGEFFITMIESLLGRVVKPKQPGRPKKLKSKE
ncbi:MAG: transposase, partial [Candidatus Kuenenia sp.]|nr:transposase [Candidatus Kuenenia sp.]